MGTETISKPASSEDNRLAARAWIDAFGPRFIGFRAVSVGLSFPQFVPQIVPRTRVR